MKIKMILTIPLVALLVSCTAPPKVKYMTVATSNAPVNSVDQNAQSQLAEAATSIGASLQQLSAMQEALHPQTRVSAPMNPATLGMTQQTSLDWNGPVQPLLQKIAQASHYRLRVIGNKPATPVLVSISARNQPLASILRNTRYQVAQQANIQVYPRSHVIELRYKS